MRGCRVPSQVRTSNFTLDIPYMLSVSDSMNHLENNVFYPKCSTGCLGGEVNKSQRILSVYNGQGISVELQGKIPAWLKRACHAVH